MSAFFLEPLDALFLRGNKLFGDPGSYGEALVPPLPSVAAGALRSRMLAEEGVDFIAFAAGKIEHSVLGTPEKPGSFRLTAFHLARRKADDAIEALFAPPVDLVLSLKEGDKFPTVTRLVPTRFAETSIKTSAALSHLPVLAQKERAKPAGGWWLTASGWQRVLRGECPDQAEHWVKSADLWALDERVGIGMDKATGGVKDGALFTAQAIVFKKDVGFCALLTGVPDDILPQGMLRLGGDGRAAKLQRTDETIIPQVDAVLFEKIVKTKRCRLILTTPGIFERGWLPTGVMGDGNDMRFELHGVKAKLVCAAVPRAEVVSGWDLANWQPKPAERAAPAGSVYWLDDLDATATNLRKLAEAGLWYIPNDNPARRAEGFNRCTLAAWTEEGGN